MFENSLMESATLLRTRNRWPALFSLTAQCAIAVLIVSLPLLHPELGPMPRILPATLVPPHAPALPRPVVLPHRALGAAAPAVTTVAVARTADCACRNLQPNGPAVDAPTLTGMNLAANSSALPLGIGSAAPAGPHITVGSSSAAATSKPIPISSGVSAGNLIAPIRPEYPAIARAAHVAGTVVVEAIISRSGSTEAAHVVSGPAMLRPAALAAVHQARYHPFLLNGQPTEVQTTITIVFRMDG